jgi:NitT/TauT family transport system substrate-binding protein
MKTYHFFILLCLIMVSNCFATEKTTLRIGVQAGGTVEWELSALPASADFQIEVHSVATAEAGKIALQSNAVDMIVSDWIWVSSLRARGEDFTFYPYSSTAGALVVPENSPIHSIKDLNGKRLGIAGGELDKNWLLLQALAQKDAVDLNTTVEKTFGAPPLITEQLKQNRIDAALTYWHFAAKLEATGYRQVIDGKGILKGLGIAENVPSLGYVFKESWGLSHKPAIHSFFKASSQAKKSICTDAAAWQKVIPLTKVEDATTQKLLRQRYCEGGVEQWGDPEQQAAARIYTLLKAASNSQLTGKSDTLQAGTFWSDK